MNINLRLNLSISSIFTLTVIELMIVRVMMNPKCEKNVYVQIGRQIYDHTFFSVVNKNILNIPNLVAFYFQCRCRPTTEKKIGTHEGSAG